MSIEISAPVPKTVAKPRATRIPELDGLRGVAIILVIVYHYFYHDPGPNHHPVGLLANIYAYSERYFGLGWSGVDLFFVLSGFLIGGILLDVRNSPRYFRTFYLRRLHRIVPAYYAWIGLFLVAMIFASHILSVKQLMALILFLQNFRPWYFHPIAESWFVPAWSLAVEEQFYLVAPLLIWKLSERRLYKLLSGVILLAPVLRVWVHYHFPSPPGQMGLAYTLMPCRADALAIGILTALLWRHLDFRAWLDDHGNLSLYSTAAFFAVFALIGPRYHSSESLLMQSVGFTWIALLCAMILILILSRPSGLITKIMRLRWLREIGLVSYCLYLIHTAVLFGWESILAIAPHAPPWLVVPLNAVPALIAYGIAILSWRFFESPLLRRGHEFKY
jgi:peptidoglycan/LPS O-acetylase OafA/YrhL